MSTPSSVRCLAGPPSTPLGLSAWAPALASVQGVRTSPRAHKALQNGEQVQNLQNQCSIYLPYPTPHLHIASVRFRVIGHMMQLCLCIQGDPQWCRQGGVWRWQWYPGAGNITCSSLESWIWKGCLMSFSGSCDLYKELLLYNALDNADRCWIVPAMANKTDIIRNHLHRLRRCSCMGHIHFFLCKAPLEKGMSVCLLYSCES